MRAEQDEKDCTDRRSESAFQDSILQDVAGCRSSRRSARTIPTQAFRPKCRFLIELATTAWDAAVPRRSPNSPADHGTRCPWTVAPMAGEPHGRWPAVQASASIASRDVSSRGRTFDGILVLGASGTRSGTVPPERSSTSISRSSWCTSQHSRTPVLREPVKPLLEPPQAREGRQHLHDEVRCAPYPVGDDVQPVLRDVYDVRLQDEVPLTIQHDVDWCHPHPPRPIELEMRAKGRENLADHPLVPGRRRGSSLAHEAMSQLLRQQRFRCPQGPRPSSFASPTFAHPPSTTTMPSSSRAVKQSALASCRARRAGPGRREAMT